MTTITIPALISDITSLSALKIFLSFFVPGLFLAIPLLYKKRSFFELPLWACVFGLTVPSLLLYLQNMMGIPFSFSLVLVNLVAVTVLGAAWTFYELVIKKGTFSFENPILYALLYGVIFLAFFVRAFSADPYFYEFDPYYYNQVTQIILTEGHIPRYDTYDWAWYPNRDSHRNAAQMNFLVATWYALVTEGAIDTHGSNAYDPILLAKIAAFYPPVVGALICLFGFVFISHQFGNKYGFLSALLLAATPQVIQKTAGGENEQMPFGMFGVFFFYSMYTLLLTSKNIRFALLAGFALAVTILGSKSSILITFPLAGYIVYRTAFDFLKRELDKTFIFHNVVIFLIGLSAQILIDLYITDTIRLDEIMPVFFALLWAGGLLVLDNLLVQRRIPDISVPELSFLNKWFGPRAVLFALIVLVIGSLIGFTYFIDHPLSPGKKVVSFILRGAGYAVAGSPLMKTVAEETPHSGDFAAAVGPFLSLFGDSILSFHEKVVLPSDPQAPFLATLGPAIFILMHLCVLYCFFTNNNKALLFLVLIFFPISFVGMSKSKYVLQHAFVIALFAPAVFGEVEKRFFSKKEGNEKEEKVESSDSELKLSFQTVVHNIPFLIILFVSLHQFWTIPAVINDISRATVQQPGGVSFIDCGKLTMGISQYLACARIPQYWREPMEWIRTNVERERAVMSWWDYGHWTNFFGQRRTVTRNDHAHPDMDLEVANVFVDGTPEELVRYMNYTAAGYVLFDYDLVKKWGALIYLSCVRNNQTIADPGQSKCEEERAFEYILVPQPPAMSHELCTDLDPDPETNEYPLRAYSTKRDENGRPYTYCLYLRRRLLMTPDGTAAFAPGLIPEQILPQQYRVGNQLMTRNYYVMLVVYHDGPFGGWEYRKGKGYDSNFYKGFFLGKIGQTQNATVLSDPRFTLVFENTLDPFYAIPGVRIFRLT